ERSANRESIFGMCLDSGFAPSVRPGMMVLELHLRHFLHGLAFLAEVEELPRRKAERGREQRRRELLDAGVVFADRVVEEAPRRRELVLDVGELGLQLLEIGVGL